MRVGIVTIYGNNYGNKLQNYALAELVNEQGHIAETIRVFNGYNLGSGLGGSIKDITFNRIIMSIKARYKNRYPYKNQRDGYIKTIFLVKRWDYLSLVKKREERFKSFSDKYIKLSNYEIDAKDIKWVKINESIDDVYGCFICGSDQVWNRTKSPYFLQFAPQYKRIAFAPSFGVSVIADELKPLYRKWLSEIPHLSVREEKGAALIQELTGREVPVLPDPTLCLSREQWESIESKPSFAADQPYVLTYFLGNETNKYRKYIESYAKRINAKIIDLYDMREPEYYAADPAEFVWLIHHAKAMFTDSFHGTVFSLIFHTPFLVFDRVESGGMGMSSRIETLLNMVGLTERRFGKVKHEVLENVDFSYADAAIAEQGAKAKSFLKSSLDAVAAASTKCAEESPQEFVQKEKQDCTGCGACVGVCPVGCITMEPDEEGFRYPRINNDLCIHCDRCRTLCSDAKATLSERDSEEAYIAYSGDSAIRSTSSSGGMFSELANRVIDLDGVVYGAGFADDWSVVHRAAESKEAVAELRGSKYVQSNMESCFKEIKDFLDKERMVYFSGTPCQVDGLLAYLGKDYENLITQDIICHGVPSPEVWRSYLAVRTNGEKIKKISFRDKTYGWHYFSMLIQTDKKCYVKRLDEDVYTRLFLENVILRPSCYACKHKHLHRKADITIADCWGNTAGMKDDDKGLSLAFANTSKGQRIMEQIKDRLYFIKVPFEKASASQGAMTKSVPYNQNRELFFFIAKENGMAAAVEEWYGYDVPALMKKKLNYRKYKISKAIRK